MTVRLERKDLISWLEQAKAGLSQNKAGVDQSNCFVFQHGEVMTFNDQVYCRRKTGLPDEFQIAVRGQKLLELLRAMTEKEIRLDILKTESEYKLVVKGRGKGKAKINSEKEIRLETSEIEHPEKWVKMPDGLSEAIGLVKDCCGTKEAQKQFMYLHIHPEWVEASDNVQTARCVMKTGFTKSHLIKQSAAAEIASIGMSKIAESDGWIHFKSRDKLEMSCRRYLDDYHDLTPMFKFKGVRIVLPKGLQAAAARCDVFSSENEGKEKNLMRVELRNSQIKVFGAGISGEYSKPFDIVYNGKPVKFLISPKILSKIVSEHNECIIEDNISPTSGRIKAEFDNYIYAATLGEITEGDKA